MGNGDLKKGERKAREQTINLINFIRKMTNQIPVVDSKILDDKNFKEQLKKELDDTQGRKKFKRDVMLGKQLASM